MSRVVDAVLFVVTLALSAALLAEVTRPGVPLAARVAGFVCVAAFWLAALMARRL